MTAIVIADVFTLECAHRRQLFAARALNERSSLLRGLPFPRTRTIGDAYVDSVFCTSQTSMSIHRQSKFSEPMLCTTSFDCQQKRASQAVLSRANFGEDASTAYQVHSDFTLQRRVSLMLTTMLQRLLGGWAFEFASRREVFASFDVSYTAAASSLACRRCRVNGALLVTGFVSLLQTNLRANPSAKLNATDPSPSGALHPAHRKRGSPCTDDHRATCTMAAQPPHHLLGSASSGVSRVKEKKNTAALWYLCTRALIWELFFSKGRSSSRKLNFLLGASLVTPRWS